MAQWIRPRTLNREVPGLNLLAGSGMSALGLVPQKGFKVIGPLVACFLSGQVK